jgi:transcription termination factor Rho
MKTAIQELIEKLNDAQRHIMGESEYANGYDGALSDCINIAELLLEKEKQQIVEAHKEGFLSEQKSIKYYQEVFGDNPEAGI